jgi:hypothetical protein
MPLSLAWLGAVSWKKLFLKALPYIAAVAAVLATIWYIYHSGSKAGQAKVQAEWNLEKLANERALTKLREDVAQKEFIHQQISQGISDALVDANKKHDAAVVASTIELTQRLHNSEQRAAYYQRMSTAGTAEQSNLASHAAELDRSLEEGRQLVQELSATVRQRDAQIGALAQQILTDRALTGEKDGKNPAPAQ